MKKKRFLIIVGILIIITIFLFILKQNKKYDNGNIANMGLVCFDGKNTFYNKYETGIFSYKSGNEKQLTDETAYSLTLANNKLYYMTIQDFNNVVIKCIDKNGQNQKTLLTIYTTISKIFVDGKYIYYATNETGKGIARVNLDGQNEEVVLEEMVQDFQVVGGKVYYVNSTNQILKKSVNKSDAKVVKEGSVAKKIQIVDNWIYYYDNQENALFRINKNGNKQELVSVLINNETYNICGKYVYYLDKSQNKICRMQIRKSNKCQEIVNLNISKTKINIAGNDLYYLDKSNTDTQTYQIYRINNNGKQSKNIEY